jgi:hypothetical protein
LQIIPHDNNDPSQPADYSNPFIDMQDSIMRLFFSTALTFAALAFTTAISSTAALAAAPLADGTAVRVESAAFTPNWHEGIAKRDADKCTRVVFKKPIEGGYSSASLVIIDHIQMNKSGSWVDVDLNELLEAEPADCREEAAD